MLEVNISMGDVDQVGIASKDVATETGPITKRFKVKGIKTPGVQQQWLKEKVGARSLKTCR